MSRASVFALACALVAIAGCTFPPKPGSPQTPATGKKETVIVIPVEAASPVRANISRYFETTSKVEAERKVDVVAEGMGDCLEVFAEVGDTVEKGQVLAELDKAEAKAQVQQLKIQAEQHRAAYERARDLEKDGLGTVVDRDNALSTYRQTQASLEAQEIQLNNLTIRAPISGIVTQRNIQRGMMVTSSTVAFQIVDPTSYVVMIAPTEQEISRVQIGQRAEVTLDMLRDKVFPTSVRRIDPAVSERGTVNVLLDFEDKGVEEIRVSAFARVRLVLETHPNALLIPKDAVLEESGSFYVFVLEPYEEPPAPAMPPVQEPDAAKLTKSPDGGLLSGEALAATAPEGDPAQRRYRAVRTAVTKGLEDRDSVEVVSGLDESDLIVVNGQHHLKDGSIVSVTTAYAEIEAKAGLTAGEALARARERGPEDTEDVRPQGPRAGRRGPF